MLVSKRDDAQNEKNDYKSDEINRKGSINILSDLTQFIGKRFQSQVNAYKDSSKLLIMTRVSCRNKIIKCLISTKEK